MIESSFHPLAILAAAVIYFGLGGLWYSPKLFGEHWLHHHGLQLGDTKPPLSSYIGEALIALVVSFILALLLDWTRAVTIGDGLKVAFLIWLGFIATTHFSPVLWAKKTLKGYFVSVSFMLAALLLMASAIILLR